MPKKNNEKDGFSGKSEKQVSKILIVNNSNLKPFIELFEFAPENINQQPLGTLLGIFEIKDDDEESAYIVNFLTSVAKKEYFISNKRTPIESFESTLHKINIALSELAKNGNIKWMGKFDAVVCALEENILHFSVAGDARVLLLRNQGLTDISEGLASEEIDPNPLKTFVNVSSGKLENDDKLIITTSDIFNIFSLSEIKKGALHFDKDKFIQFVNTALVNELEIAGTIILDVFETSQKEELKIHETPKKRKPEFNAFSEASFKKKLQNLEMPSVLDKKQEEYIDDKTGHIYVHGEYQKTKESGAWSLILFNIKEKLLDFLHWARIIIFKKSFSGAKKGFLLIGKGIVFLKLKISAKLAERSLRKKEIRTPPKGKEEVTQIAYETPISPKVKESFTSSKNFSVGFLASAKTSILKILPSFSKIRGLLGQMSYQQKIYTILIVLVIILAPLIWLKITGRKSETPPPPQTETEITKAQVLSQDKNIILDPKIQTSNIGEEMVAPIIFNDQVFLIARQKIIKLNPDSGEREEFSLPENSGNIIQATPMNDLSLIFLLTDNQKLFSFSPNTSQIKENSIPLPQNAQITAMATYLTYIYLLDSQNSSIYRYPRAEGGFGEGTSWLKDSLDLKNASGMAIDENIYVATGDSLIKLFKGQEQDFNLETSATPINFDKVFTDSNTSDLYILDKANGRLVKFAKTGEIISQYYSPEVEKAIDFTADEKNNKAYFVTSDNNLVTLDL